PRPIKPAGGVAGARRNPIAEELHERIEGEVGDLFFVLVNLARFLDVDPESALRRTTQKFRTRFEHMEGAAENAGLHLENMILDQMESLWQQSKFTGGVKQ